MKKMAWLLLPILLLGCGGGAYKIPKDEYRDRVRTLGVVPLLVDGESTIKHPQRQEVVNLLRRESAEKHERLLSMVRDSKSYFDVRRVHGDPQDIFHRLVRGTSMRGEGDNVYRRYHFDGAAAARLASENMVDGLLVVIFNGVERVEKRRDRGTSLSFLEAPYNSILATAAVVLPSGEIAWEYGGEPGVPFLPLQYADFDEAFYNRTDEVKVRFISTIGLERNLTDPPRGVMTRTKFPGLYLGLFERITAGLKPGPLNPLKGRSGGAGAEE